MHRKCCRRHVTITTVKSCCVAQSQPMAEDCRCASAPLGANTRHDYSATWSRLLHLKLTVAQLVKKSHRVMQPEGSSPCTQQLISYPKPQVPIRNLLPHWLSTHLQLHLPGGLFPSGFSITRLQASLLSLHPSLFHDLN